MASANLRVNSSASEACTMNRLAAVLVEPPLRSFANQGAGDGLVQVGVGEDDEGRVAAELHGCTDDGT